MKIIIAGGRDFNDYDLLRSKMDLILKNVKEEKIIISGGAKGADILGERYAIERGYPIHQYLAEWDNLKVSPCVIGTDKNGRLYNKVAGHNRNKLLVDNADVAVYFWNYLSKGTENCIKLAKLKPIPVRIIKY